ncbi:MAG: hypothetical protein HRT35_02765 [Algicola sp.]|nr:hypothetical protein [Algicola sp.]
MPDNNTWTVDTVFDNFIVSPGSGEDIQILQGDETNILVDDCGNAQVVTDNMTVVEVLPHDDPVILSQALNFVFVDGGIESSSAGGTLNHAALNSLLWDISGHTGDPDTVAGFDSSGDAIYVNPDSNIISLVAGEALGGQKWVTTNALGEAILADSTAADGNKILGMTITAASSGASVDIKMLGELTDPSFSFTPDVPIWLGLTGLSTQTAPSIGIVSLVAQALTATKIFIRIQQTIQKV